MHPEIHLCPYNTPVRIILHPYNNYLLYSHDLNYIHTIIYTQKYNTLETYASDHLSVTHSPCSTISHGCPSLWLLLLRSRTLPPALAPRSQPQRPRLDSSVVFFFEKKNGTPSSPLPSPRDSLCSSGVGRGAGPGQRGRARGSSCGGGGSAYGGLGWPRSTRLCKVSGQIRAPVVEGGQAIALAACSLAAAAADPRLCWAFMQKVYEVLSLPFALTAPSRPPPTSSARSHASSPPGPMPPCVRLRFPFFPS